MTQPLSQLNDIHEVTQVSWWPLAWGWWLIIAVGVAALILILTAWLKKRRHQKVLKQCIAQLENEQRSMGDITTLLKIAAMQYIPHSTFEGASIRTLTGEKWLHMLNGYMPTAHKLQEQDIKALSVSLYKPVNQEMLKAYQDFANKWLTSACPRRLANV